MIKTSCLLMFVSFLLVTPFYGQNDSLSGKKNLSFPDTVETDSSIVIYSYTCSSTTKIVIPKFNPHILMFDSLQINNSDSVYFVPHELISISGIENVNIKRGYLDTLFVQSKCLLIFNDRIISKNEKSDVLKSVNQEKILRIEELGRKESVRNYGFLRGRNGTLIINTE